jgi:trk system potassium uptake protein
MHPIQRILGLLLMLFSLTMLVPVAIAWFGKDSGLQPFLIAFGTLLGAGSLLWLPARRFKRELRLRDGFMVVVLFWFVLGIAGAVPLYLALKPALGLADAVFESLSGLTTTGATVITHIEELPASLLMYRQLLQWLGGMGIIVLAVAILPMLGVGGMQLYRAETPGPMKDNKLTPRITETAKALWYIYLGLTVCCGFAYWWAGMSAFDAIGHSFATVAIGGFSTHDASLGHFDSPLIEAVAVVFMAIAGMNFALHYIAFRGKSLSALGKSVKAYTRDEEWRTYVLLLGVLAIIVSGGLWFADVFGGPTESLRYGIFQTVSIATTTGFTTAGYHLWPSFLPVLLLFASFVGGCAGSTGGGLKVIRVLLLIKQGRREVVRLMHPSAHVPIKVGGVPMSERVMDAVWSFFAAYVGLFAVMMLGLMATGLDQVTAFSAVVACLNNLGPGLGGVGSNYADLGDTAKWILCFAMVLGRLEIFTLLVVLSRSYWRD